MKDSKNNFKFLTEEEIDKLDFFEAAMYAQLLNQIEKEEEKKDNMVVLDDERI